MQPSSEKIEQRNRTMLPLPVLHIPKTQNIEKNVCFEKHTSDISQNVTQTIEKTYDIVDNLGGCNITKLLVMNCRTSATTLHDSGDLKRMIDIYDAKQQLSQRSDVLYYIDADDLLKISETKETSGHDIYLRLVIENPRSISRSRRDKLESPHKRESSTDTNRATHRELTRTGSSDSNKSIDRKSSPKGESRRKSLHRAQSAEQSPKYATAKLVLFNALYTVKYFTSDAKYSIFKFDAGSDAFQLICWGLIDSQVKADDMISCKAINVTCKKTKIEVTIYIKNITRFVVPTYVIISTLDYETTIGQFIPIFEVLFLDAITISGLTV